MKKPIKLEIIPGSEFNTMMKPHKIIIVMELSKDEIVAANARQTFALQAVLFDGEIISGIQGIGYSWHRDGDGLDEFYIDLGSGNEFLWEFPKGSIEIVKQIDIPCRKFYGGLKDMIGFHHD